LGRGRGRVSGSRPCTASEIASATSDEEDEDASSDSVEFDGAEIEAEAAAEEETKIREDGWEVDRVPMENICQMHIRKWRALRRLNPYRFSSRQNHEDHRFWTKVQPKIMQDVYLPMSKRSTIACAKSINTNWMHLHGDSDAPLLRRLLEGLGLWSLACFNQDYCPELVQQFYCTVYYHKSGPIDLTWMCGNHKISSTKLAFVTALGSSSWFEHENMHAQLITPKEDLLFCYPADKRSKPGVISTMYPTYRQLAYVLKDTICQKAGDYSDTRPHGQHHASCSS
jgi:hypothetical protein